MSQSTRPPVRERRGAHRPGGLGVAGALPWLVAAVVIVAVVTWATGWWGPGGGTPNASNTVTAGASPSGTRSSATSKAGSTGSASSTGSRPTAPADRTVAVSVLNSTRRSGLAATAASTLRQAGWTIRATGNSTAGGPTTVYYGKASLQATAAAVAADLGAPAAVEESADFGATRVTVVLGTDFPG